MALDDTTLLKRWTTRRDAEAFDEIVGRFADPVYGTCWRILRNDADAEEITQECFLHLVRSAGEIRSSLGGWLHRVATTKSLDRIRREIHRRERERVYEEGADAAIETAWDDIQEHIDAAIDTLPDDTRDVIVAHFLQRKTHAAIAADQAVSRRAISYRIARGLEAIRRELRRRGVSVTTAALGTSLATEVSAAPLSLKATLGKLAIAVGTNSGAVGATTTSSLLGSLVLIQHLTLPSHRLRASLRRPPMRGRHSNNFSRCPAQSWSAHWKPTPQSSTRNSTPWSLASFATRTVIPSITPRYKLRLLTSGDDIRGCSP